MGRSAGFSWEVTGCRERERVAQDEASGAAMIVKPPCPGDKILIFRPQWLQLILCGEKRLEIRAAPYKSGTYYLGSWEGANGAAINGVVNSPMLSRAQICICLSKFVQTC